MQLEFLFLGPVSRGTCQDCGGHVCPAAWGGYEQGQTVGLQKGGAGSGCRGVSAGLGFRCVWGRCMGLRGVRAGMCEDRTGVQVCEGRAVRAGPEQVWVGRGSWVATSCSDPLGRAEAFLSGPACPRSPQSGLCQKVPLSLTPSPCAWPPGFSWGGGGASNCPAAAVGSVAAAVGSVPCGVTCSPCLPFRCIAAVSPRLRPAVAMASSSAQWGPRGPVALCCVGAS